MNKNLFDFIQSLSKKDPKTLSQKTLKTCEEVGELAKAVLPFENAPQHEHKFSSAEKILEEVSDTVLGALSVAYNLGFSTSAIEEMIWKKSEYWASLQNNEKVKDGRFPFEIHVTVAKNTDMELLKAVCGALGVNAIGLDLLLPDGSSVLDEKMTSSRYYGTNLQAYGEMKRISNGLKNAKIPVIREKIETSPWHPACQGLDNKLPVGYFEAHIEIETALNDLTNVMSAVGELPVVTSYNKGKVKSDGSMVAIITYRSEKPCSEPEFKNDLENKVMAQLSKLFKEVGSPLIEYAVYDTNVNHDKMWLTAVS